jgi:hypothetical protein
MHWQKNVCLFSKATPMLMIYLFYSNLMFYWIFYPNSSESRWAMGSITQKGKPSDHGSISTANASNSQVSATATPGIGNFILPTVFFVCVPVTPRL